MILYMLYGIYVKMMNEKGEDMKEYEKLSNIESLISYLMDVARNREKDEHYKPIYDAQTTEMDKDYVSVVKMLYKWTNQILKEENNG